MKYMNNYFKSLFFAFLVIGLSACMKDNTPDYSPKYEAELIADWTKAMIAKGSDIDTTDTGLLYIVEKTGTGVTTPLPGDEISVKYIGTYTSGITFDNSAFHFSDGNMVYIHRGDRLIPGFEEAVDILKIGDRAAFLIPSAKAYGEYGSSAIPPYTPLVFAIELVSIN
jgi:FKBP-type peptidyl-prolyl cis-trans isomerase